MGQYAMNIMPVPFYYACMPQRFGTCMEGTGTQGPGYQILYLKCARVRVGPCEVWTLESERLVCCGIGMQRQNCSRAAAIEGQKALQSGARKDLTRV
jgi:hypothetical protein